MRYVYQESNLPRALSTQLEGKAESYVLKAESLTVMPAVWCSQLYQAATQVDAELILQLIDQIPQENATLTNALADLVSNFRFDQIIALTQLPQA